MGRGPKFQRALRGTAALIGLVVATWAPACQAMPEAGQRLPPDLVAAEKPIASRLRRALAQKDEAAVRREAAALIALLGDWAGVPDARVTHYLPINRSEIPVAALLGYWEPVSSSMARRVPWVGNPAADPARMTAGLRVAGDPVDGYARLARVMPGRRAEYEALARQGADFLLRTQRADGSFPFPDLRGRSAQFAPMIEKLLREVPGALDHGWIIDDAGAGDMNYDTSICGVALLEAWRTTGELRYRQAAVRAAQWASGRPLVANWNYNAFAAWLEAEVARDTQDPRLLESAVTATFVGVLPGMTPQGRWFDQHNARRVYHGILVRGLIATWEAMPPSHPRREELRRAIYLALENACAEIRSQGATNATTLVDVLGKALLVFGENPSWTESLTISVNAILSESAGKNPDASPPPGCFLANYIEWRLRPSGARPWEPRQPPRADSVRWLEPSGRPREAWPQEQRPQSRGIAT